MACDLDFSQIGDPSEEHPDVKIGKYTLAASVTAVMSAAAISFPTTADAAPSGPNCVGLGQNATQCQTNGSVQIRATPPEVTYPTFFGPYSLFLHHRRHR